MITVIAAIIAAVLPFSLSKVFKVCERVKVRLLFFGVLLLLASGAGAQYHVNRIVLDAGHGGKDPGALGSRSREKDIALSIALKTGEYIEKYLPGTEVIYTRKTDVFVELHRRAQIANSARASLFVSIHCNASKSPAAYGTETYVMGLHRSDANLEVAKLENAAILNEENYADMYEGFDPNQDEDYITLTMFQDAFLDQSTLLADEIQRQFRERVKRKDRGVFQAGFLVLYKTTMPGVLIETGFITNPEDEKFLMSDDGQVYLASAIFRAIKFYKEEMEREDNKAQLARKEYVEEPEPVKPPEIYFRVQFLSSKTKKTFTDLQDGYYKYSSGNFTTWEEARKHQAWMRDNKKYKDAFIIGFKGEDRISPEEARKLIEK